MGKDSNRTGRNLHEHERSLRRQHVPSFWLGLAEAPYDAA